MNNNIALKLNWKRTFIIGFAFFGILLLWQVYDSWCPTFLTELFKNSFNITESEQVQYLVGIIMALDNLAALILLPIFGNLSDKTKSPIGKRMPYIIVGTLVCAIAFPFVPVFFHMHSLVGTIIMMAVVVFFAAVLKLRDDRALHHEQHVSARAPVVGEVARAVLDDARADVALRKGAPQRRARLALVLLRGNLAPVHSLVRYAFDFHCFSLP